jgi:hypothetical protein
MGEQPGYCSWRIFHNMNFTQLHERLRLELVRRIQRGTLSVSLLARQTGIGQPHLSNFLRSRRTLSLEALDRVLFAQHITVGDLVPVSSRQFDPIELEARSMVPLVSHAAALFEPFVRPSSVRTWLAVPAGLLGAVRSRPANHKKPWVRFVAISISEAEALPMDPLVQPDATVLLDRHYHSLAPYHPNRPNVYAVRNGKNQLDLRYLEFAANRLVLRPHNLAFAVELLEIPPGETAADSIAGRVVLILNDF